jgi:hypothetical protein
MWVKAVIGFVPTVAVGEAEMLLNIVKTPFCAVGFLLKWAGY